MTPPRETTLALARPGAPVLATGAWFKNTICVARGGQARLSRLIGDLDSPAACLDHEAVLEAMLGELGEKPALIAHDLHPDFHSSRCAAGLARRLGVALLPVQHHHAHIAALCAEHGVDAPVIGLALDGVGLGTDGMAWGGELLRVDGARCDRLGHFAPLALPGGDRAAREPWRMAAAALHACGRGGEIATRFHDEPGATTLVAMLDKGLNAPPTSSAGRLFDAAAGLLNLSRRMAFEAEAAIALEQAATRHVAAHGWPAPLAWRIDADNRLDMLAALAGLADAGADDGAAGAARFHATLVAALAAWAERAAHQHGLTVVACGGGCFLNKLMAAGLREKFAAAGLTMLEARRCSPGDAGVALGQAWIAQRSCEEN